MEKYRRFVSGPEIRANAEKLTDEFARRFGYVFAQWLAERAGTTPDRLTIAVGRDSRASGRRLSAALVAGLTAADSDVLDCGLCAAPALAMTTIEGKPRADGAVMITASAHAPEMNGFKAMQRDGQLTELDLLLLVDRAEQAEIPERLVRRTDALQPYLARLEAMMRRRLEDDALRPLLGIHVVVDAGGGTGGFFASFLEDLGACVDGSFGLSPDGGPDGADPEDPAALERLARAVTENEADMGVLLDPDCARVAIVDESGRAIHRNRLIALAAAILLEESPGATFVTDSVTSSGLARFIEEWGGTHYRYKRGHRNVIDEAVRLNREGIDCPLAMETSGHAAFRENFFLDDGVYLAARLVCEAFERKRQGQTLASLIDELQEPVERVEIRLPVRAEDVRAAGQEAIEAVLSHTLDDPEWTLANDNREGVRILFNLDGGVRNAWFLLRLSLHDPVMPLNAESDVPGGVHTMLAQLLDVLEGHDEIDLEPLRRAVAGNSPA